MKRLDGIYRKPAEKKPATKVAPLYPYVDGVAVGGHYMSIEIVKKPVRVGAA